jgi:hypothetical protein
LAVARAEWGRRGEKATENDEIRSVNEWVGGRKSEASARERRCRNNENTKCAYVVI